MFVRLFVRRFFSRNLQVAVIVFAGMFLSNEAYASCPAANPFDSLPDDVELQNCLDLGGTIVLQDTGEYIIAGGLHITVSGTVLTSSSNRGWLVAHRRLAAPILRSDPGVNGYTISNIIFHGNKAERATAGFVECSGYRDDKASNVRLFGDGFWFENNISTDALCGSSTTVEGSNFIVRFNQFVWNGYEASASGPEPWADGLTIHNCVDGQIYRNDADENTDIGIVVGGGRNCRIESNIIRNNSVYAFAGLHIGWFPGGNGNHDTNVYGYNESYSGFDKMGGAVVVGYHPWDSNQPVVHAGSVVSNTTDGAVVNLLVDGIDGGTVNMNTYSNARGTRGLVGCPLSADYTVSSAEIGAAMVQPGWIHRFYHQGVPCQ